MQKAFNQRSAGVLLHITSLPGAGANGTLGIEAYHFIDFMLHSGLKVWQMLPIGPTHSSGSPYSLLSTHAGNPDFIDSQLLQKQGWISENEQHLDRISCLRIAFEKFMQHKKHPKLSAYNAFCASQNYWLEDYCLYQALREHHHHLPWWQWPLEHAHNPNRKQLIHDFSEAIRHICFIQYIFFEQWKSIKQYANKRNIILFGDIPLFVAQDSADVWANQTSFLLNAQGLPHVVAGVPPDYYSATGQRWGNPLFNWETMKKDNFSWWCNRIRTQLYLFDILRIDHFRGLESCWHIDADEETAINGKWVKSEGKLLLQEIKKQFNKIPLVAEDLGIITDAVEALRTEFKLPGMKILQFAFDNSAKNPYLNHNINEDSVVYTGTHDNDTTMGWFEQLNDEDKAHIYNYLYNSTQAMPWALINMAFSSVARLAIIPMQDFLALGTKHRMNQPGTVDNNWHWRFQWQQVNPDLKHTIHGMISRYGR